MISFEGWILHQCIPVGTRSQQGGGSVLALARRLLVDAAPHFGLALVQAGADGGKQILTRLADLGVGVEQAALEDIGAVAQGAGALAQTATYVFPYEGFRYTQREDETVLTQTNLGEHEALLKSLGTSSEAVLASYVASGIVMEVIPDDGGQIAVSVTDAGKSVSYTHLRAHERSLK